MKIILSLYKRLFFVLLACLPISLMAQTVINSDGIRYLIENDHALIGRQNKDLSGAIVIPSSILYDGKSYNVTGFVDPTNLTSWSSNIVTCEGGAFQDCQITSIVLPSTITSINAGAFDGCRSLSKIILPEQLINIGAASFANCTSLQELSIPSTVTSFGSSSRYGFVSYTFGNCSNLKAINIPDGISALWEGCFMGCDIDSLYIPEGMQTLADNSLAVRNLRALKIGVKDLTKLSYSLNTFGTVDNAKLYVPKGSINVYQEYEPWSNFKTIQEFGEGSEIFKPEQINITENGIKYILKDGFATIGRQNKSLKGCITIPSSIQYEGVSYAVSSIITPKDLTCYSSESITITGGAFQETEIESIELPNSIATIPAGAFYGCDKLREVKLPSNVKQLGAASFAYCSQLTNIEIPSTVTDLASQTASGYCSFTFGGCTKLKSINIPEGVNRLASGCFMWSGIEEITLGANIQKIAEKSLAANSLKTLKICIKDPDNLEYMDASFGNVQETDLIVPKGSKCIYQEYYPWMDFKSISEYDDGTEPVKPNKIITRIYGIRYILANQHATIARQNKDLDGDIVIPETVTFEGNTYTVTNFIEPTNIISWSSNYVTCENGAFQDCKINSIKLPNTISVIGAGAFYGCDSLNHVDLPNSIIQIGAAAFANCGNISEIYLPETIKNLGSSTRYGFRSYVFGNCSALKKVNIPKDVTKIGIACFKGAGIETFIVSPEVNSLEEDCFSSNKLRYFKVCHQNLTDLSYTESCFKDVSNIILLVPQGTSSLYKEFYPWKEFKSIQEYKDENDESYFNAYKISYEVKNVAPNKSRASTYNQTSVNSYITCDYMPSGIEIENLPEPNIEGYKFLKWENIPSSMPSHDIVIAAIFEGTNTGIKNAITNKLSDGAIYTIEGIKVKNSQVIEKIKPGIYIRNGKKFVVK